MIKVAVLGENKEICKRTGVCIGEHLKEKEYRIDAFSKKKQIDALGKKAFEYDIYFVDVDGQEMNNIDIARNIRKWSKGTFIVLITDNSNYLLEGYKLNAVRCIFKEDASYEKEIAECLDVIVDSMDKEEKSRSFRFVDCVKEIPIEKILYVESHLHKINFHLKGSPTEDYVIYQTLNSMEAELSAYKTFVRAHQSYLVNLKHIKDVKNYRLTLDNGEEINVAKKRYRKVKDKFLKFKIMN
ncbi:MAG: LytTR family DNA-binding domain-containing protein [Lachnospiraceae bacterium]|nr:LytTR family DNA-binding domain-containing protein [Lachnospiraceae bacterium]